MTCLVCHRSLGAQAKKCPVCGAPAALSNGIFLFEINTVDKDQLAKYYDKSRESENDNNSRASNQACQSAPQSTAKDDANRSSTRANAEVRESSEPAPQVFWRKKDFKDPAHWRFRKVSCFREHEDTVWKSIWALPLIGLFLHNSTFSFILIGLTFLLSAYLIAIIMSYSPYRTMLFGICTAISIISLAAGFFYGNAATETANATMTTWISAAETAGVDIAAQLTHNLKYQYGTTIVIGTSAAFAFLNYSLANYESKNNPYRKLNQHEAKKRAFRKILAIIGIVVFFILIAYAAYKTGLSLALKREMTNYFAAVFPGQTITF